MPGSDPLLKALAVSVLVLPILGMTAHAAGDIAAPSDPRVMCIGAVSGAPGTRVSAPVTIEDAAGVAAFQVDIRYDPALLTLVGAHLGADTAAAGGWLVDGQNLAAGAGRVLGYSNPPVGLTQGLRTVAVVDFDVVSPQSIDGVPFPLADCVLGDSHGLPLPCAFCIQPGVDGAVPRFAISLADDGFAFKPATILIESGDWVLWKNIATSRTHTTTSGTGCLADGRWRGNLPPGRQFARSFPESPGAVLPYFSEPDCLLGMTGEVDVTTDIHLSVDNMIGSALLTWTGGSGLYRVERSDTPGFVGPTVATFTPDGGDAGTSFSDPAPVAAGTVHFYMIVIKP
jgi:plastocyanin